MPELLKKCVREIQSKNRSDVHAVYSEPDRTVQFAFFRSGFAAVSGYTASAEQSALLILIELAERWGLPIGNPQPDQNAKQLILNLLC